MFLMIWHANFEKVWITRGTQHTRHQNPDRDRDEKSRYTECAQAQALPQPEGDLGDTITIHKLSSSSEPEPTADCIFCSHSCAVQSNSNKHGSEFGK